MTRRYWLCERCSRAWIDDEPCCACHPNAHIQVNPLGADRFTWWSCRMRGKSRADRIAIYGLADSYDRPRCHRAILAEAQRRGRTYTPPPLDEGTITAC